jgi:REP element-mobilizing transposase RayT
MASHIFHEIYLHLNWHTKDSKGLLTPTLESQVHAWIEDRCRKMRGVYFHEIGGTANHIHLAINIEPHVCVSDLVGDLKGACSYEINQTTRMKRLQWQRGFGVVSFGMKQLPWVRAYIKNQKEHHAKRSIEDRLERVSLDDDGSLLDG